MKTYTISEIAQVFDGPHATPKRQDSGHYFLNISSLSRGRLDLDLSDHVSDEDFAKWTRRVTPLAGDLLFSYETRLGEAALMPEGVTACLGRRMGLLRPNRNLVDPRFLLYFYLAPPFQKLIEQNTIHGATVNRIPLNSMGSWSVRLPQLPEQQAIAEVLGALDDKIAANTALATKSLELADRLFPRESPESSTRLGDVVSVVNGNSYKSADLGPSDHALVTLKSITRDGRYAVEGLKQFAGRYKPEQVISSGEIVVAKTDLTHAAEVVGRAVRVPANDDHTLVASLDLAIVRPLSGIDRTYLLGLLRQSQFREYCRINTTGTTVLHLRSGAIEEFTVQLASSEVQEDYARVAAPLQQAADSVIAENRTLAATRA